MTTTLPDSVSVPELRNYMGINTQFRLGPWLRARLGRTPRGGYPMARLLSATKLSIFDPDGPLALDADVVPRAWYDRVGRAIGVRVVPETHLSAWIPASAAMRLVGRRRYREAMTQALGNRPYSEYRAGNRAYFRLGIVLLASWALRTHPERMSLDGRARPSICRGRPPDLEPGPPRYEDDPEARAVAQTVLQAVHGLTRTPEPETVPQPRPTPHGVAKAAQTATGGKRKAPRPGGASPAKNVRSVQSPPENRMATPRPDGVSVAPSTRPAKAIPPRPQAPRTRSAVVAGPGPRPPAHPAPNRRDLDELDDEVPLPRSVARSVLSRLHAPAPGRAQRAADAEYWRRVREWWADTVAFYQAQDRRHAAAAAYAEAQVACDAHWSAPSPVPVRREGGRWPHPDLPRAAPFCSPPPPMSPLALLAWRLPRPTPPDARTSTPAGPSPRDLFVAMASRACPP